MVLFPESFSPAIPIIRNSLSFSLFYLQFQKKKEFSYVNPLSDLYHYLLLKSITEGNIRNFRIKVMRGMWKNLNTLEKRFIWGFQRLFIVLSICFEHFLHFLLTSMPGISSVSLKSKAKLPLASADAAVLHW